MAAVRCPNCGAVVSVIASPQGYDIGDGRSFRGLCKALQGGELDGCAEDCSAMRATIKRASFRIAALKGAERGS